MAEEQYIWTDNPTISGVSPCNTDVLNDCLMFLKSKSDAIIAEITELSDYLSDLNMSLDGQWVNSPLQIASRVTAPTSTNRTYSLAEYLPADGYDYEVLLCADGIVTGAILSFCNINLQTDIITDSVSIARVRKSSGADEVCSGNAILPIGTYRQLILIADSANAGTISLFARGYRRIGKAAQ